MDKSIWVLITIVVIATTISSIQNQYSKYEQIFQNWKQQFGYSFTNEQQIYRKYIFLQNYQDILTHNAKPQKSYEKGLNHFSHLSSDQFAAIFTSIVFDHRDVTKTIENIQGLQQLSDGIDYVKLGMVSAVKNQGFCNAGYAFSTVSLAQSYLLFKERNQTLSEQQVIDCAGNYTTLGCNGGSRLGALNYVKEKGLSLQSNYPWKGSKGACSTPSGGGNKFIINDFGANGCYQMMLTLSVSPLTVSVNAKQMQSYKSGIFDGCDGTQANHDIFLVGFTSEYWKLKNSWGQAWGESGYMRLKQQNTCGICDKTAYGFSRPCAK